MQHTNILEFKGYFHNVSICTNKDSTRTWHELRYFVEEHAIKVVFIKWLCNWLTPSDECAGKSKTIEGKTGKIAAAIVIKKDKEKEAHKSYMTYK